MTEVYLFDWGDTLMVDFPGVSGKMCDWKIVKAVNGAQQALKCISKRAKIYVVTGASESTEDDIKAAFSRVELDQYICGYFCKANLGVEKGSPDFLLKILNKLNLQPHQVTMVGDSFSKDIAPAHASGINTIWLSNEKDSRLSNSIRVVSSLTQLSL